MNDKMPKKNWLCFYDAQFKHDIEYEKLLLNTRRRPAAIWMTSHKYWVSGPSKYRRCILTKGIIKFIWECCVYLEL